MLYCDIVMKKISVNISAKRWKTIEGGVYLVVQNQGLMLNRIFTFDFIAAKYIEYMLQNYS